jgi:hypothetical protein
MHREIPGKNFTIESYFGRATFPVRCGHFSRDDLRVAGAALILPDEIKPPFSECEHV